VFQHASLTKKINKMAEDKETEESMFGVPSLRLIIRRNKGKLEAVWKRIRM
jgi:hypothetical protein